MERNTPSLEQWLREAKEAAGASGVGMYLIHNGVVRETARAKVRQGQTDTEPVRSMVFSYDKQAVEKAVEMAHRMEGIGYVRVWLNQGRLAVGEDLMVLLIGGDIRPHVMAAMDWLLHEIKTRCVTEKEEY